MSAQMPELGSKISLISKADIRYEGRLFTVDPQECTIALASVRSFGTEDRDTQYPVPAQNQVYDYILFRGSDIKDIRVVNTQMPPNDPAIVQLVPPNQQVNYPGQNFAHPVLQYPPYGTIGGGTLAAGLQRPGPLIMQPISVLDLIGGGSRSTTPGMTRKSPTNDQGTQVNTSPGRDDKRPKPIQPPTKDINRQQQPPLHQQQQQQRDSQALYQSGQRNQNQQRYDRGDYYHHQGDRRVGGQQYQRRGGGNGGYRNDGNRENRDPRREQTYQMRDGNQGTSYSFQNNAMRQSREGNVGNTGWAQRQRPHQRPRSGGPPKQYNRGPPTGAVGVKKTALKFEGDYDFDKANTEFEALMSQLTKVKIGGSEDDISGEPKVNGEIVNVEVAPATINKKEIEHEISDDEGIGETCYDKTKSFFDTISCEAVERSKGRSQRTDWRTERKLNSETFGVASARRGNFRTRGYYNNRNYRPQGGYRRGPPRPQHQQQQEIKTTKTTNSNEESVAPPAQAEAVQS